MYTEGVVRLRCFALVLALLIAAGSVVGAVCELDCDQPPAKSSACHGAAARDGATLRGAAHACGHAHGEAPQALPTGGGSRDQLVTSAAALSVCVVRMPLPAPGSGTVAMHGPPGLNSRTSRLIATVLRI